MDINNDVHKDLIKKIQETAEHIKEIVKELYKTEELLLFDFGLEKKEPFMIESRKILNNYCLSKDAYKILNNSVPYVFTFDLYYNGHYYGIISNNKELFDEEKDKLLRIF
ncbi:MAG: hypothetical protein QXG00_03015 [Candidatus Woesearchaeota archaeon]